MNTERNCVDCERPMLHQARLRPGYVAHRARGRCTGCDSRVRREGKATPRKVPTTCVDCGGGMKPQHRPGSGPSHKSRGLCRSCHQRHEKAGTLIDFPRLTWSRDELLDEWVMLRGEGHTVKQAAARLGMTQVALSQALLRARKAGDPRAGAPLADVDSRTAPPLGVRLSIRRAKAA